MSATVTGNTVTGLEAVLRRDRWIAIAALTLAVGLSWLWLVQMAVSMTSMDTTPMDMASGMASMQKMMPGMWSAGYAGMMLVMWMVMMIGMMLPSAAPMILLHARFTRKKLAHTSPWVASGAFLLGYLAIWAGFGLAATGLQWWLEGLELVSAMKMAATSSMVSGLVLIAAAVWQLTSWKEACLENCRSPIEFLSARWRSGTGGAFRIGLDHGLYCLGCCWALMLLLFVGGVMNLVCIAALTAWVLVEKLAPSGHLTSRLMAGVLAAAGIAVMLTGWTF